MANLVNKKSKQVGKNNSRLDEEKGKNSSESDSDSISDSEDDVDEKIIMSDERFWREKDNPNKKLIGFTRALYKVQSKR